MSRRSGPSGIAAAKLVSDGMSVILDSGTTTRQVADALLSKRNLTIYTNDLGICRRLGRHNGNKVVLLGGVLQDHENAVLGPDSVAMLSQYFADFAFVGVGGITMDGVLTDYSREASELRGLMLLGRPKQRRGCGPYEVRSSHPCARP